MSLELDPHFASNLITASPPRALLVVMSTTPFAPRAPYIALAAASLSTDMDSTSFGLISEMDPSYGIPSTM